MPSRIARLLSGGQSRYRSDSLDRSGKSQSKEMEGALKALLNYSVVPVVADTEMETPAFYDQSNLELAINPAYSVIRVISLSCVSVTVCRSVCRCSRHWVSAWTMFPR